MRTTEDRHDGGQALVDRLGRPYTPTMLPGHRKTGGSPVRGQTFPPEVFTPEEIERLLSAAGGRGPLGMRNRALLTVLWRTGLRISEALALELRDLDLPNGTLTVRHGKGDRRRVVGIDPPAAEILAAWLDCRAKLVPGRARRVVFCTVCRDRLGPGRPLHDSYVRALFARMARRARIDKRVHPHGFRHTHAVELLREGISVAHIQRQLGHRHLSTTARYLDHLLPFETVELVRAREWPQDVRAAA